MSLFLEKDVAPSFCKGTSHVARGKETKNNIILHKAPSKLFSCELLRPQNPQAVGQLDSPTSLLPHHVCLLTDHIEIIHKLVP